MDAFHDDYKGTGIPLQWEEQPRREPITLAHILYWTARLIEAGRRLSEQFAASQLGRVIIEIQSRAQNVQ